MSSLIGVTEVRDAMVDLVVLGAVGAGENALVVAGAGLDAERGEVVASFRRLMVRKWITEDERPVLTRTGRAVLSYSADRFDALDASGAGDAERDVAALVVPLETVRRFS